jgi:geranylgeranyl pyrophosphate synthase
MNDVMDPGEQALNTLFKTWGNSSAHAANSCLLASTSSQYLRPALQYFTKRRRDLLRPTLIHLACQAVGGVNEQATPAAIAMILTGYHLGLIDDVIDRSQTKLFHPTMIDRVGVSQSLLIAILCYTRAHYALAEIQNTLGADTYHRILQIFTAFPTTMVEGERLNIRIKKRGIVATSQLMHVLIKHAADIEACTQIGALVGGGSEGMLSALTTYGHHLGILLLLNDDTRDALNYSLALDAKIISQAYPYPVIWAANQSVEYSAWLKARKNRAALTPDEIETSVQYLNDLGAISHVRALMKDHTDAAASILTMLPLTEARKGLATIARAQPSLVLN